jgi:uncharacterized protein involved in exopolysaccharide biosynthesis
MLLLGLASVISGQDTYRSTGTLRVTNESLLADLTNSAAAAGGFETPATVRAREINELLGTAEFMDEVVRTAGIEEVIAQGLVDAAQVRSATSASAGGDSIVRVSSATDNPELSFRLADATIRAYRAFVVDSYVSQSTSTEQSLSEIQAEKQTAVDEAIAELTAFIDEQPNVPILERSAGDQLEYTRLQAAADRAQTQLLEAQDAVDAAKVQTDQAAAIVDQRVRLVDEPAQPSAPDGRLKKAALTMVVFGVLGCLLSLGSVVLAASLDRTIRVPNDITARFGVDVLAVVPNASR